MRITSELLMKYILVIERNCNCKVVGLSHDDMEPLYKLDIFVETQVLVRAYYLHDAHFVEVDFVKHTMRFHIFDDEMALMMNTIAQITIEESAPKLMN